MKKDIILKPGKQTITITTIPETRISVEELKTLLELAIEQEKIRITRVKIKPQEKGNSQNLETKMIAAATTS